MKHNLSQFRPTHPLMPISCRVKGVAPAFTLIEMLIVITIITILLTVGSMGLKNMSKASGVSAGLPVAEAVFSEAKALAVGKGTKTRVLIHGQQDHADEYHRERYLRYMAIAYEELDDSGTPTGDWVLSSKGSTLPKGVYFVQSLSENEGLLLDTMVMELPGKSDTECYYYEFNAEGLVSSPVIDDENDDAVPRFVICSGSLSPGSEEPQITGKNVGGFVIWRSGRTSLFRHPDQIDTEL